LINAHSHRAWTFAVQNIKFYIEMYVARHQRLMSVILITQEAEIRRIVV
jgi:hypothetical protein